MFVALSQLPSGRPALLETRHAEMAPRLARGREKKGRREFVPALVLVGVCLVHAGAVAALLHLPPQIPRTVPEVNTVAVRLLALAPPEPVPAVVPPPPVQTPVPKIQKPTPKPVAKVQPRPKPVPNAEPVPRAEAPPAPVAPAPPPLAAPVREATPISEPVVQPPRFDAAYLRNPAPSYPPGARRRGQQGKVMLRVEVDPEGRAGAVAVAGSSGVRELDNAAVAAVRRWQFVPARQGDRAVRAAVLVPVSFRLKH